MNPNEAGGDLALIQTSLLFSFKCKLISISKNNLIYKTKAVRSVSPRGVPGISSDRDDRRIFLGFKFSILEFFGYENLASIFLGSLI